MTKIGSEMQIGSSGGSGGGGAPPPTLFSVPKTKKLPYLGRNMLQNASFEALDFKFSRAYETGCEMFNFLKKSAPPSVCQFLDPPLGSEINYLFNSKTAAPPVIEWWLPCY